MILDENGKPNTYWLEWKEGQHQTDYNNCRFAEDKLEFAKNWLLSKKPEIDWKNCKNIVDIIAKQKLRFIIDSDYCGIAQQWADKVNVKQFIEAQYQWPYEIFNRPFADEIEKWKELYYSKQTEFGVGSHQEFWLKTNHGSGWNLKVDLSNLPTAPKYIEHKLNEWCNLNYAYISGYERQYENIKPQVIIEPHKCDSPIDYGFWCGNGMIEGISLTKKLGKNLEAYLAFVDACGKKNPWYIGCKPSMDDLPPSMYKRIEEIIPYVKELCRPFDFVRVDFNYVEGHWYFGEMTFTPCSGILDIGYNK